MANKKVSLQVMLAAAGELGRMKGIDQVLKALEKVDSAIEGKYGREEAELLQKGAASMHKTILDRVLLLKKTKRKIIAPKS